MAAALIVAGTGLSMYSAYKGAQSDADLAARKAGLNRLEAQEIMERARINTKALQRQGALLEEKQKSAYARGGVDIKGSPLQRLEQTRAQFGEEIAIMQREASFKAGQLEAQASIYADESAQYKQNAGLAAITKGLGGASSLTNLSASRERSKV